MGCCFHPNTRSNSNSVGEMAPNSEIKIVSDDDGLQEVEQGKPGEMWIRAPSVMKGYWMNPEATEETVTSDGWLKTGDIGYLDKTNHLFIVDRKKASHLWSRFRMRLQTLTACSGTNQGQRSPGCARRAGGPTVRTPVCSGRCRDWSDCVSDRWVWDDRANVS